jgi:spore coat protein U-like protein
MRRIFQPIRNALIIAASVIVGASTSYAANTGVACSLTRASLALGTMDPLFFSVHDRTGEIEIRCRNYDATAAEVTLTVQFSETQTGYFMISNIDGSASVYVHLYADPARTQALLIGAEGNSIIQRTLSLTPKHATDIVIPVYARLELSRQTVPGNYQKALAIFISY